MEEPMPVRARKRDFVQKLFDDSTPGPFRVYAAPAVIVALLCLVLSAAQMFAQASLVGQWQTLPATMPINPVHVALLRNGKILVVSGSGNVASNTNYQAGVWDPATGTVTTQPLAWDMFCNGMVILSDGRPFIVGGTLAYDPFHGYAKTAAYDPSTGQFNDLQTMAHGRWYGSSVLLPLTPANGYRPRIMIFGGGNPATATTEVIDLSAAVPAWQMGPPMSQPRIEMNAVLLPTGKVLTLGGSTNDEDATTASLNADLFDADGGSMTSAGQNVFPRLYHSVAILLPDARVWVAGGNPQRGT